MGSGAAGTRCKENQLGHYQFIKRIHSVSASRLRSRGNGGRINSSLVLEDALPLGREQAALTNSKPIPKSYRKI